jgi:hypothetical protein
MPVAEHVWALTAGGGNIVYAGNDSGLLTLEVNGAPEHIYERARWRPGEEGAERSVRGIGVQGSRVFALLTYGPAPSFGSLDQPADPQGYGGALRVLEVEPDGRLVPRDELPLAANHGSGASYRVLPSERFVGIAGGYTGLTLLRHGPPALLSLYLPLLPGR